MYSVIILYVYNAISCTYNDSQKNNHSQDTTSIVCVKNLFNQEEIISLIKADESKKNLWTWRIECSESSPLFYEAETDDGLYLYHVYTSNQKVGVTMIDDDNILWLKDFIECSDTTGIEYEHKGRYDIINDSVVSIKFDKFYRNICYRKDTMIETLVYHMQCRHNYTLSQLCWILTQNDTIIVLDARNQAYCEDAIPR